MGSKKIQVDMLRVDKYNIQKVRKLGRGELLVTENLNMFFNAVKLGVSHLVLINR